VAPPLAGSALAAAPTPTTLPTSVVALAPSRSGAAVLHPKSQLRLPRVLRGSPFGLAKAKPTPGSVENPHWLRRPLWCGLTPGRPIAGSPFSTRFPLLCAAPRRHPHREPDDCTHL